MLRRIREFACEISVYYTTMATGSTRESSEEENGFAQPEIGDEDIDNVAEDFRDGLGLVSLKEKSIYCYYE